MMDCFNFNHYNNIVIKVGSALVAPDGYCCSTEYCLPLANFIKKCRQLGKTVTLVSSGAVAAGFNTLKPNHASLSLDEKQALAAIGQSKVINHWQRFFDNHVAQVLLTAADISNSTRSNNAKRTLQTLHQHHVLPIINENDTVAIEELKFGDNDNLAARVAKLIGAELLIICSDVDGVYDGDPHKNSRNTPAKLIRHIPQLDDDTMLLAQPSHNPKATGGMKTKLEAAKFASQSLIDTIICNGKTESYLKLLTNNNPGTWIPSNKALRVNKHTRIRISNAWHKLLLLLIIFKKM
ncbi:glutamate 5-kinase [Kangiella sp. HD9-110m-PIT-SAG06]|nr:glutamate 5-kinase [Kangiella sp. HD9-110m-PIT-SAG06]RDX37950.1 glutamate 5-kinase [Kangiella sp. HD9-110m-PIT-SAG07]